MSPVSGLKSFLRRTLPVRVVDAIHTARRPRHALTVRRLRHRFIELNRGLPPTQVRLRPGLTFQVEPSAREGFEAYCWSWPEMVEELDAFLALSEPKKTLVDVGALHGIFSLTFAHGHPDKTALAVEPSSEGCRVLAAHLASNEVANVAVERVAVGAGQGKLPMVSHGLLLEVVSPDDQRPGLAEIVDVPMKSVDDLCQQRGIRPDLLKVDVEGYEFDVLKGSERVLQEDRPAIMLELHPDQMRKFGSSAVELLSFLAGLGYEFHNLRGRALAAAVLEEVARRWGHLICTVPAGPPC